MNERIKKLRKALDLTQQEFADRIGMKRNTIASYEINRNGPSNSVISLICKAFNVSEMWLRTGEGEMFIQQSKEDELSAAVEQLLSGESSEFKRRLIVVLSKLDIKEWEMLEKRLNEITAGREAPAPYKQEQTQSDIAAELAEFKRKNQEMAAKMAAMEEELALLETTEGYDALPSVSNGSFSPMAKK